MSHWKLTLSYDGTCFHGWQVQPGLHTVQGTLRHALGQLIGEDVLPQGSGRTDTGVHALGQVASFTLAADIPAENLFRALNRLLPRSIRVLSAEMVPDAFHARFGARRKTYEYRIFEQRLRPWRAGNWRTGQLEAESELPASDLTLLPQRFCSPFQAPYAWEYKWPLSLHLMQQAALSLVGTHDFTSFAASDPDLAERNASKNVSSRSKAGGLTGETSAAAPVSGVNPQKTIHASTCLRENDLLIYRVTGSGFLHHMVRNIVGTLTEIGRGAMSSDAIPAILAARDRTAAGPTAPPQGLYLVSVEYAEILQEAPSS
jgi:tRNA pseudouridine38-40 synthase